MKKYFSRIMTFAILALISVNGMVFAQPAGSQSFLQQNTSQAPELPGNPKQGINISDGSTGLQTGVDNVLKAISNVINWVLGLLALIALIILIYTGVKMLFNSGDDGAIEEGYKTIKNIFIALLFIGASFLIVQFIFYIISLFVGR